MFPIPIPQIYEEHEFAIYPMPEETGEIQPLTLSVVQLSFPTLRGTKTTDISFSQFNLEGSWERSDEGLTTTDPSAKLSWKGIAGTKATVVFASGENRGQALIKWDGTSIEAGLFRPDSNEKAAFLSYDMNFAAANSLLPTLSIAMLLCFFFSGAFLAVIDSEKGHFPLSFFTISAILFVGIRIFEFVRVDEPLNIIDSAGYIGISRFPVSEILSGKPYCYPDTPGYCQSRPWAIPLLFKLCHQDLRLIALVFLILSLFAWIFSVLIAASSFSRPAVQKAAILCLFGLGCASIVSRWEVNILSESLSISAGILMIGCWIWLFRFTLTGGGNRRSIPAAGLLISAIILTFTRDSNIFFIFIAIASLAIVLILKRNGRKFTALLISAFLCLAAIGLGTTGDRWKFSYFNILFMRILRDENAAAFFLDQGMPSIPEAAELIGVEHSQGNELFQSASLDPLRNWVDRNGIRTYLRYLLRKPAAVLHEPFMEGYLPVAFGNTEYRFHAPGYQPLLPEIFQSFFGLKIPFLAYLILTALSIRKAMLNSQFPEMSSIFGLLLSSYLLSVIIYSLDSYDFIRQSTQIIIQQKWALWYAIFYILDRSELTGRALC